MDDSFSNLVIRNMQRAELDRLVDWAAGEGWNPGLSDADIFWQTDPEAFIAAELDGKLVGGGSIVSYSGHYGFMGFFIIHPDYRGRGLGNRLWHERLKRLRGRLKEPAVIGMDGVFDMQPYYAKGGFCFAGRDLRFEGTGEPFPALDDVLNLEDVPFTEVEAYDHAHFPAPRSEFLKSWISQPGSFSKAIMLDGKLAGFGVIRPCRTGYKIGPLFADNADFADALFRALVSQVPGEPVYLDVPEGNPAALELAHRYNMGEVFGCAKMYFGPAPKLPEHEIFGITTFELG